ncbi:hypothetical protein AVEN_72236-1 [Araneus ventricosus]|uniref:Uncharacterized protein n=1 Tax=Araneus ventricosus TaxID=182803 RepID=A0A4Y2M2P9_ARAVE|nr:hypothetical protein AVEN_72236-1 [Araneus ventricosus]
MQRSAVVFPHGQFAVEARLSLFQYEGNGPCPVKNRISSLFQQHGRDSWQDVECGPPRICIFPVCLPVLHHFFLKIFFRKDIGALTESGSLSDSTTSFANLFASSFPW